MTFNNKGFEICKKEQFSTGKAIELLKRGIDSINLTSRESEILWYCNEKVVVKKGRVSS